MREPSLYYVCHSELIHTYLTTCHSILLYNAGIDNYSLNSQMYDENYNWKHNQMELQVKLINKDIGIYNSCFTFDNIYWRKVCRIYYECQKMTI